MAEERRWDFAIGEGHLDSLDATGIVPHNLGTNSQGSRVKYFPLVDVKRNSCNLQVVGEERKLLVVKKASNGRAKGQNHVLHPL